MMKAILTVPFIILLASCGNMENQQKSELIQDCPEEKIVNKMPMAVEEGQSAEPNAYFIYKGERKELEEFDLEWVAANCDVKETEVY